MVIRVYEPRRKDVDLSIQFGPRGDRRWTLDVSEARTLLSKLADRLYDERYYVLGVWCPRCNFEWLACVKGPKVSVDEEIPIPAPPDRVCPRCRTDVGLDGSGTEHETVPVLPEVTAP